MINKLIVKTDCAKEKINKNIYGHFAEHLGRCIYEGIWVGEDSTIPNTRGIRNDVVEALRKLNIPVLRWPGGCFADTYHWKDGVGPKENRKKIINSFWGGVVENNHFGTHEFFDLCEMLECEPYICGNLGSGTVQEMQEWVEYITFDGDSPMSNWRRKNGREKPWSLKYFGIGNENWGCGGRMRPEYYADLYRHYSAFIRDHGDVKFYKIACGANHFNYQWTEVLMREAEKFMEGLSLHYYTYAGIKAGNLKRSATNFPEREWFTVMERSLLMEELIIKHGEIMDKYDPKRHVGLIVDEWGTWHQVEPDTHPRFLYQQNTLRDAISAAVHLNIFNKHCERVQMANIAQTVNVLQAMVLTEGEKMILTPTYHVFEMYKVHQEALLLPVDIECGTYTYEGKSIPQVSVSASKDSNGKIHITLCNVHPSADTQVVIGLQDAVLSKVNGRILTASTMDAHNSFDNPDAVKPTTFYDIKVSNDGIETVLPAKSVVLLIIE